MNSSKIKSKEVLESDDSSSSSDDEAKKKKKEPEPEIESPVANGISTLSSSPAEKEEKERVEKSSTKNSEKEKSSVPAVSFRSVRLFSYKIYFLVQ